LPPAIALVLTVAGCSSLNVEPFPEPLNSTPPAPEDEVLLAAPDGDPEPTAPTVTRAPGVPGGPAFAEGTPDDLGQDLTGEPISVAFNDAPLPNFIDELFNQRLGLSFLIAPNLRDNTDLVTLRIAEPMSPADLFTTARRILEEYYGVRIRADEDGVLTFEATDVITDSGIPLLISGRASPEVPATHRTVFQIVHTKVMSPTRIEGLLARLLSGVELDIRVRPSLGAIMLKGSRTTIDRAIAIIEVLDQPLLSGRNGIVIEPVFLDVAKMATDLSNVLRSQGYSVSVGYSDQAHALILLPLRNSNKLVVFAADPAVLLQVEEWAAVVDAEREAAVEDGWFFYQFKNTLAEDLTDTLNQILSIEIAAEAAEAAEEGQRPRRRRTAEPLVFEKSRNAVLYRGNGEDWARIRQLIERLDKPVPQVLIEVLLAEVTLTGKEESGIEYLANFGINGRGVDALLTAGGVSFTLDGAGATRALLRLAYEDNRVALRSLPRLIVKSGESGNIFAGSQVPILSQRAEGVQVEGTTSIVQQIQYRDTGVTLNITPIVQANGLVDLEINQNFSETRAAGAASLTPTILTRDLSTSMTLRDGQSVLMGGLISESQSQGQSGVPGLGRVPIVGRLFRADSFQNDRTELVVMVIPYVIADHRQSRELTEQIKSQLELHRRFL
ncbi:MAG: hypothetical protein OXP36_05320, partial [Gammaproteobacteria bacterium]|nr:hypothetical protein [Gammaproteobacteria bacterium]